MVGQKLSSEGVVQPKCTCQGGQVPSFEHFRYDVLLTKIRLVEESKQAPRSVLGDPETDLLVYLVESRAFFEHHPNLLEIVRRKVMEFCLEGSPYYNLLFG